MKGAYDNSSGTEGFVRSNTDQLKINANSDSGTVQSQDTGNLSIFGGKNFARPKADWREFFEEQELDKAYQIVEVEQRDETDAGSSDEDMGSNSDPSEDNLDQEEVYRELYGIKNPEVFIETKKKAEQEFIEKVNDVA